MKNSKTLTWGLVCGGFLFLITSCEKPPVDEQQEFNQIQINGNENFFEGPLPEATVKFEDYSSIEKNFNKLVEEESSSTLTGSIEATLRPEESHIQTLTGTINGGPSVGDMMFVMDLTGSMGGELSNAKVNSVNIMNAIRGLIPNTNFGLISHMDYNSYYSSCGYSDSYGGSGDYPYMLDNSLTENIYDVQTGLTSLLLGYGSDGPESYTRALWELANDSNIGWRSGSKRVAIAWLDNIPHDCNVYELIGGNFSTGVSPGRDGIANNEDDIDFNDALLELSSNNISLITLYSGDYYYPSEYFQLWTAASEMTGGRAYQINSDGTIPGGTDIATYLAELIAEDLNTIEELTIEVCDPAYEAWFTNLDPAAYYNLTLDEPISKDYEVTITAPAGTLPGVYEFELCLVGDGAVYATTDVTINVPEDNMEVSLDVHPTSCPNPIGLNNRGLTPVSISGSEDFNVEDIDVSSIYLEGVSATFHSFEDVSTPYSLSSVEELDENDCHTLGADGIMDLSLKFDSQELLSAIGPVDKGDVILITLTGQLLDGSDFRASDIITIR